MRDLLFRNTDFRNKNVLIVGSPRSGTHALASVIRQRDPTLKYLGEIGMIQRSQQPWQDYELFCNNNPRVLGHAVQSYGKLFAMSKVDEIKAKTLIVELRRRNKVKQFASWCYFKHIGATYDFDHTGINHVPQCSLTATRQDLEEFLVDQIVDTAFAADYVLYYEDLDLSRSKISKNQYAYPIEEIFGNLDFVQECLENWKYNEQQR